MSKILLTGASGLLGAEVLRQLVSSQAHEIYCLGRTAPALSSEAVHFIPSDFAEGRPAQGLPTSVDAVVHLAQSDRFREFPQAAAAVFEVNVAGIMRLLDWAHGAGARTFIHASTGGVYAPQDEPIHEDSALEPLSSQTFYAATKRAAESLAASYGAHMTVVGLRYFFIYGPEQRRSMLMPRLIDNVAAGRPIALQGETGMRFNPVHVADGARATIAALQLKDSATINVAGPEPVTLHDLGCRIGARLASLQHLNGIAKSRPGTWSPTSQG